MGELMLCLFLIALGALVWNIHRDASPSPAVLWAWGWLVPFVSGIVMYLTESDTGVSSVRHLFGPLLPAFMLAGALAYTDARIPRWLLPGALALGAVRWGLFDVGVPSAAHALALIAEPGAQIAAAVVVFRAMRGATRSPVQRILPAVFVMIAAFDASSAVAGLRSGPEPPQLLWGWLLFGPVALGLQITAAGHRARDLRRRRQLEQLRVQERLSESEERFRAITEHAFDLIAETDDGGRITYTNPRFEEVLGISRSTLLGRAFHDLVHSEDRANAARWHRALVESDSVKPVLSRWPHASGELRWLESTGKAFRSADGAVRIVICSRDVTKRTLMEEALRTARDELELRVDERTSQLVAAVANLEQEVSARRRAEDKLRVSEERYRTVSELSTDLSFSQIVEPDGSLVNDWVTQAVTRITGYTAEEIDERGWVSLVHPDDRERIAARMESVTKGTSDAVEETESRIITKRGDVRWLRTRLAADRSHADGKLRVVGATSDITDQKQAELERERLEAHIREVQRLESLGVLAGGIAHDFNNLLSVILGNSALALADLPANSPLHKRLTRIRSAAKHAAGLTDQMLTYSGKASVTLKMLHLPHVIEGMRELLEASITNHSTLDTDPDSRVPLIEGDETQMRQVIMNLVTNASEALQGRSGNVTVRTGIVHADRAYLADAFGPATSPEGDYVYLDVSDTGSGIEAERHARVFEPFFTTKFSGRGLGLAAVLGIVQGHRGAIKIWSHPERGTTFRVLLPPAASETRDAIAPHTPDPEPGATATVLVIDDDEPVLELGREFLERFGFEVFAASGGREGVELFRANAERIDAVVLDLTMPGMDGEDTLREIRRLRRDVPVILVSGFDEERAAKRFATQGIAGFLCKPYDAEALVEKIRACLKQ